MKDGRVGALPVPAVLASAIEDAVGPCGGRVTRMPLGPARLMELLPPDGGSPSRGTSASMIRLAERTWPEAQKLARDERAVVLLPLGAVEQHGPHLPLLVDWLGAEEIARRIAPHLTRAGYRVVLAPALPYGASPLAERWPGTVSLSRGTLVRLIVEVVRGLARAGFRRVVLTNYQADAEHLRAMAEARARLRGVQVLFAGFDPGAGASSPMVNPRVRALNAESPAGARVALGRDRDVADAVAPAGPRAPTAREASAARVDRFPRSARAGSPALRGHRAGRRRLLRLARGGAGEDGRSRHAPARRAHRPRAALGARASARSAPPRPDPAPPSVPLIGLRATIAPRVPRAAPPGERASPPGVVL